MDKYLIKKPSPPQPPERIKVGRRVYGGKKYVDPQVEGFITILCLTPSTPYGPISSYSLTDSHGRNMENIWQFSKVYRRVPRSKQHYSRFSKRVIWDHPAETHVDGQDRLNPTFWAWRAKGMAAPDAIRYPVGFHQCIGALPPGLKPGAHKIAVPNKAAAKDELAPEYVPVKDRVVELLDYVESRKRNYLPVYARMLQGHPQFLELKRRVQSGENLLIVEVDGPHHELLDYYRAVYGVGEDFIAPNHTVEVTEDSMRVLLDDPRKPFGHGYCLGMALLSKDRTWNQ